MEPITRRHALGVLCAGVVDSLHFGPGDGRRGICGGCVSAYLVPLPGGAEAGLEIGYQFRPRVRIGVRASYTTRDSPFQTFGVDGLLAGLTVQYNPPQPTLR